MLLCREVYLHNSIYFLAILEELRNAENPNVEELTPKNMEDYTLANWRDVVGYEGRYIVSDEGEIISLPHIKSNGRGYYTSKRTKLKSGLRGRGNLKYPFVILAKDGVKNHLSVHRIVAEAFIANPEGLPEVNHIDENPLNANANNLEWCTRQYNIEYSKAKRIAQYDLNLEKIAEYKSITYAAKITNIKRRTINNALTGWANTAGGYVWKYVEEE